MEPRAVPSHRIPLWSNPQAHGARCRAGGPTPVRSWKKLTSGTYPASAAASEKVEYLVIWTIAEQRARAKKSTSAPRAGQPARRLAVVRQHDHGALRPQMGDQAARDRRHRRSTRRPAAARRCSLPGRPAPGRSSARQVVSPMSMAVSVVTSLSPSRTCSPMHPAIPFGHCGQDRGAQAACVTQRRDRWRSRRPAASTDRASGTRDRHASVQAESFPKSFRRAARSASVPPGSCTRPRSFKATWLNVVREARRRRPAANRMNAHPATRMPSVLYSPTEARRTGALHATEPHSSECGSCSRGDGAPPKDRAADRRVPIDTADRGRRSST